MTPCHFIGQTHVLEAPTDYDQSAGEIGPLPCAVDDCGFVSVWRPSADELSVLLAGGGIVIRLMAPRHPPMALGVCLEDSVLVEA